MISTLPLCMISKEVKDVRKLQTARPSGGELGEKTDAVALAKFFVATIQGMRAMARLKSDRRALRQVAKIVLAVFDR